MSERSRRHLADAERARNAAPRSQQPNQRMGPQPHPTSSLLALQRTAGNAAVTEMIAGGKLPQVADARAPASASLQVMQPTVGMPVAKPSLQRDSSSSQGGPGGAVQQPLATTEWTQQRNEMEGVRQRATVRQLKAEACIGLAADVLGSAKTRMEAASTVYGTAYESYSKVIEAGGKAAKREEEFIEIGVSILLAVGIATGVGAAAEALEIGAGLAIEAGKEAIVATTAEAAKYAGKHTGLLEVVGSNLQPGGLTPSVMKLGVWEKLVDLHAAVLTTIKQADLQSMIASGAEYAIGEIKAQIGGGAGADLPVPTLHNLIGTLAADDAAFPDLDTRLSTAISNLQAMKASLGKASSPYGREWEMERDIWILWMAELPDDEAKVLDIDVIENHLEELKLKTSSYMGGGLLGVDTGIWTTKNDCLKMIEAAKEQAGALREKYGSFAG